MNLAEMINQRKSTRSYTGVPVDAGSIQKIEDFIQSAKPLFSGLKVRAEIIGSNKVRCILPWKTPQVVAMFAEKDIDSLVNVGFLYQQLDLYLQSIGLGSCWLGMGRLDPKAVESKDELPFVMMLAFGNPKGEYRRNNLAEFKRKSLDEISDKADTRLEPARLAPSSINSQPWYFVHEGENLHVYCACSGILKKKSPSSMNLIDIGIALAHLYVSNSESFRFFKTDEPKQIKNYAYIGSVTL